MSYYPKFKDGDRIVPIDNAKIVSYVIIRKVIGDAYLLSWKFQNDKSTRLYKDHQRHSWTTIDTHWRLAEVFDVL